jgi:antitoxin ParD1/3/4
MQVQLTPALEKLIQDRVESGLYVDESDVVREALRRLDAQDRMDAEDIDGLRAAIDEGLAEIEAGLGVEVTSDEQLRKLFPNLR